MKFTTPATTNPIDRLRVVGHAIDRVDGKLKTTGTATYAYEQNDVAPHAAYGYIVGAAIAKGSVTAVRVRAARLARRAVKVAMTRPMMFNNTTHRPATIQRLRIGATHAGIITAIGHEKLVGQPARRQDRSGHHVDPPAVCRRQPHDPFAPGHPRSGRRRGDARARGSVRHDGA
ncbi:MAG: xanthine dehydrogenase [Massilia sp.]|nr:xanthine dehydrogenase [Massilia sp.]